MSGTVYLVGAGPGDAGLLTLRARELIAGAQVVVYDRLVSAEVLELVAQDAKRINAGKNAGNHPVPQHEINQILVDEAKQGKTVVRLKGGDSFVFGRGGEELEALVREGIAFEVVPGITSAIAAATYAGIPVTHRDYCSSVHLITGHKQKDGALELDYPALVRLSGTLIFMMSVASAAEIAAGLIAGGMAPDMDCAIVENGTRPCQRKFLCTLDGIADTVRENAVTSPSLIIVGRVCSLSRQFDWFSNLPLKGKRILVTRPKMSSAKLASRLRALGADVTALAAIKTMPLPFSMPDLTPYRALVFTSVAGVDAYFERLFDSRDARALGGKQIAVIGRETGKALLRFGLKPDFIPSVYSGQALAKEMLDEGFITKSDRLLLLRARESAPELADILTQGGVAFDEVSVYETSYEPVDANPADFDLITFTSASCVEGFARSVDKPESFHGIPAVCIGEKTAQAARRFGLDVRVSKEATIDSMVELILDTNETKQGDR